MLAHRKVQFLLQVGPTLFCQFVFPDPQHVPTLGLERTIHLTVSCPVSGNLLAPEFFVGS
jgi:hypothetical protein